MAGMIPWMAFACWTGFAVVDCYVFDCTQFSSSRNAGQSVINSQPVPCTADAIPFCLANGTMVIGRCAAQTAYCIDQVEIDDTFQRCSSEKTAFDCTNYDESRTMCTKDLIPYCLTNGTIVRGTCDAKKAVCLGKQQIDDTFAICDKPTNTGISAKGNFDCTNYQVNGPCHWDLIPFCLKNGTTLYGTCDAKRAVCLEKQQIDDSLAACDKPTQMSAERDNSGSSVATASIFLLLSLILLH